MIGDINVGQELLNVPMGDMIQSMALAIADAQWQLDKSSMTVAELMTGQRLVRDLDTGKLMDDRGRETGRPRVVDSRVFFGYKYDERGNRVPNKVSMIELGFTPTFYQFVDTIIEVRIAISIQGSTQRTTTERKTDTTTESSKHDSHQTHGTRYWWWGGYHQQGASTNHRRTNRVSASSVDASYSNKYSYSVEAASLLRTKLAPVPPPAILEERIRELMEMEREYLANKGS